MRTIEKHRYTNLKKNSTLNKNFLYGCAIRQLIMCRNINNAITIFRLFRAILNVALSETESVLINSGKIYCEKEKNKLKSAITG